MLQLTRAALATLQTDAKVFRTTSVTTAIPVAPASMELRHAVEVVVDAVAVVSTTDIAEAMRESKRPEETIAC